jgi:hypothetical protein
MTTLRQIEANRINAQRSTGPRSPEGKEQSRRNALKHGLAGAGVVLPEDEDKAVERRKVEWHSAFRPGNVFEEWLTEQIVVASVQIDRCQHQERALRAELAVRASTSWDDDRRLAAEILAGGLARKPAMVAIQLRQTSQGCDWLIDRWIQLGLALERSGQWTNAEGSLALDLLGTAPDLRDGPTTLDPPPGDDPRSWLATLVVAEIEKLQKAQETDLADRDARDRAAAELGLELETPRPLSRLRRYEAACHRRLKWALTQIRRGKSSTSQADPAPASAPFDARLVREVEEDPLRVSTLEEETAWLEGLAEMTGLVPDLSLVPEPSPTPAAPSSQPDPSTEIRLDPPPDRPPGGNRRARLAARRRRRQHA